MKSRSLKILFIYLLSINGIKAQVDTVSFHKDHKLFVSISAGVAIPIGDFTNYVKYTPVNSSSEVNYAGAAATGFSVGADLTYSLSECIGVTAIFSSLSNQAVEPSRSQLFPEQSSAMGGGGSIDSYTYNIKNWQSNDISAGVYVRVLNTSRIIVGIKATGGLLMVKSPEVHLNETGQNWIYGGPVTSFSNNVFQSATTSSNFAFNIGADLRIHLNNRFGVLISINDIISGVSSKGSITEDYNDNGTISKYTIPFGLEKNINLFCISAGVSYAIK